LAVAYGNGFLRVLNVIPTLDPEAGGPAEGVRQWGLKGATLGHSIEVLTLDAPGLPFLNRFPLQTYALGPSKGHYRYNERLVPWLKSNAARYDAVIVNGIWQYHSFGTWRALRSRTTPYYVFTHGMLDPWFRHRYPLKHVKKWLYWPWATYRALRDARAVLFTSEEERLRARQSFWLYRANERVVGYGTSGPPEDRDKSLQAFHAKFPELRAKSFLLFLGRIHEKKGCDLLVRAFAEQAHKESDIHLVMAGPDQTGWAASLKEMAARLGVAERITWIGMVRGDLKWGVLHACEAFVLPSHQENFGIAVAEALACAKPVLISNKVNIWREIQHDGAGLVGDDTQQGVHQILEAWRLMPIVARQTMSQNAVRSFQRRFTVDIMAESLFCLIRQQEENRFAGMPSTGDGSMS
jgi:glycosyltransferase involved in cell wall biosynthesis